MVRLVFRPYTQVWRSICTSEPLRASTRVSSGFALLRHSSPSFGSLQTRSGSAKPAASRRPAGRAGGAPTTWPRGPASAVPPGTPDSLSFRLWGSCWPNDSRVCKTPWSVFQDGSDGGPALSPATFGALRGSGTPSKAAGAVAQGRARPPRCPVRAAARRAPAPRRTGAAVFSRAAGLGTGAPLARSCPPRPSGRHPAGPGARPGKVRPGARLAGGAPGLAVREPAPGLAPRVEFPGRLCGSVRFPLNGFTYSWTLSSKFFSTFPHGTCSLSASCQCLALGGVYHPLWAAFSNNPTPGTRAASARRGSHGPDTLSGSRPAHGNFGRPGTEAQPASLTPQCPSPARAGASALGSSRFTRRY